MTYSLFEYLINSNLMNYMYNLIPFKVSIFHIVAIQWQLFFYGNLCTGIVYQARSYEPSVLLWGKKQ